MKIETIVMMVLVVGFILMTVGLIVSDLQVQYPEVNVNSSAWSNQYDYSSSINTSATKIQKQFEKVGEEEGWLSSIVSGAFAIPTALVETVKIVLNSIGSGVAILTGLGTESKIDPKIIGFGVVAIIIGIVFSIVRFWRKEEIT